MLEEMETLARRLEQQISVYEKLHADEMKKFQEQFETLQRIQADELQMLRKELAQLKEGIAAIKAAAASESADDEPAEPTLTRRDLLTGKMPPLRPKI